MFFFFSLFVQTYFSAKQISNMRTWSTTKVKPSPLLVSLHSECIYLLFFSPFSLPWPDSEMDISSLTPQWISFVSSIELSSVLERERGGGGTSTIGFWLSATRLWIQQKRWRDGGGRGNTRWAPASLSSRGTEWWVDWVRVRSRSFFTVDGFGQLAWVELKENWKIHK